jgi:hypothetical protein
MFAARRAVENGRDLRPAAAGMITAVLVGCGFYFMTSARTNVSEVQAAGRAPIPGDRVAPKPAPISLDLDSPSLASAPKTSEEPPVVIEPVQEEPPHAEVVQPGAYGLPEPRRISSTSGVRRGSKPRGEVGSASGADTGRPDKASRHGPANGSDADITPRKIVIIQREPEPESDSARQTLDTQPTVVNEPARPVERKPIEVVQTAPRVQPRADESSVRPLHSAAKPPKARVDAKKSGRSQSAGDTMSDWHRRFLDDP